MRVGFAHIYFTSKIISNLIKEARRNRRLSNRKPLNWLRILREKWYRKKTKSIKMCTKRIFFGEQENQPKTKTTAEVGIIYILTVF